MSYTRGMRVEQTDGKRDEMDGLKDWTGRARIRLRVDRLIHGNPDDHRSLTNGITELRVDVGPGYRVCCSKGGSRLLLLRIGGDESTQDKDIAKAQRLAAQHQE